MRQLIYKQFTGNLYRYNGDIGNYLYSTQNSIRITFSTLCQHYPGRYIIPTQLTFIIASSLEVPSSCPFAFLQNVRQNRVSPQICRTRNRVGGLSLCTFTFTMVLRISFILLLKRYFSKPLDIQGTEQSS